MLLGFLLLALSGCFTPSESYLNNIPNLTDQQLAIEVGRGLYSKSEYWLEVKKRGLATSDEWHKILGQKIWIGMTDLQLVMSWGLPEDINSSVGSWGKRDQYVYGGGQYVYVVNGKVTSWQT